MRLLLPLYVHPAVDPGSWVAAASLGASLSVIVNVHDGPGQDLDPVYLSVVGELNAKGVQLLGYVDLAYGLRPILEILDDIARWTRYPGVGGVFFDCAPTGAERAGTVALAGRAARRQGLRTVLLNPGTKPDPLYRALADGVCVFEGHWRDYQGRMAAGYWRNACHLVYGVPFEDSAAALGRLSENGARWGMLTEFSNPLPWAGMPRWVDWLAGAGICEVP
jgi:Spherulation-specific family 4